MTFHVQVSNHVRRGNSVFDQALQIFVERYKFIGTEMPCLARALQIFGRALQIQRHRNGVFDISVTNFRCP
jgi:hypothetical protein